MLRVEVLNFSKHECMNIQVKKTEYLFITTKKLVNGLREVIIHININFTALYSDSYLRSKEELCKQNLPSMKR